MFRILFFVVLLGVITSCDLSPDLRCEDDSTCSQENASLACFKGRCFPKVWIAKVKKRYEDLHNCQYCPPQGENCVDVTSNEKHCGACGEVCGIDSFCENKSCQCSPWLVLCSHGCVELSSNPEHCGKCDLSCLDKEFCYRGKCVEKPCNKQVPPLSNCNKACVDLNISPLHCGECNKSCRPDQLCSKGKCACVSTQKVCSGRCVDIKTNNLHCGNCGRACVKGEVCASGRCVVRCPVLTPNSCFGGCFNTKTSVSHCGECGKKCASNYVCINGECLENKKFREPTPDSTANEYYEKEAPFEKENDAGENHREKESDSRPIKEQNCKLVKEICDGKDNDCNGQIDDLSPRDCYNGPPGTAGKGLCKKGKQECFAGKWARCVGEVIPVKEDCDHKDNDCDGKVDEFFRECYYGPKGTEGVSHCKKGKQFCEIGIWRDCIGQSLPQKEDCDLKDNDCDGKIDGDITKPCFTGPPSSIPGIGICKYGKKTCKNGKWGSCVGEVLPRKETCNNIDDDCNGSADNYAVSCYSGPAGTEGKGVCKGGFRTCAAGKWGPCSDITPSKEVCDKKDNDCDGTVDEGCP